MLDLYYLKGDNELKSSGQQLARIKQSVTAVRVVQQLKSLFLLFGQICFIRSFGSNTENGLEWLELEPKRTDRIIVVSHTCLKIH